MAHALHLIIQDVEKSSIWRTLDSKVHASINHFIHIQNMVLPPGSDANPEWPLPVLSLAYDSGDEILPLWQEAGPEKSLAFIKNFHPVEKCLQWLFTTFKLPPDVHFAILSAHISSPLREIWEGARSDLPTYLVESLSALNLSMSQILKDFSTYSEKRQNRISAIVESYYSLSVTALYGSSKQEIRNALYTKYPPLAEFSRLLFQLICRCMPGMCLDYFLSYWSEYSPETKVGLIRNLGYGRGISKYSSFADLEADLLPMLKVVLLHTENTKYYKALLTGLVKLGLHEKLTPIMIELLKHTAAKKQYSKFAISMTALRSLISGRPDLVPLILSNLSSDPQTNLATYNLLLGVNP